MGRGRIVFCLNIRCVLSGLLRLDVGGVVVVGEGAGHVVVEQLDAEFAHEVLYGAFVRFARDKHRAEIAGIEAADLRPVFLY